MSYDNACKFLAERYPQDFLRLFPTIEPTEVEVLKTELSIEPIRADSVTFLRSPTQIQHLEFETRPTSKPPIPLRMLDYYTRLKRSYDCRIFQCVIFLKETDSESVFVEEYTDINTRHRYQVIRMWEQDPALFLNNPGLLPLAVLARSDAPEALLERVASEIANIEDEDERRNISGCAQILAGLRHDKPLISQLFREDIMKESVIYQEIVETGRQQGEVALISRQIARRFGEIEQSVRERIQGLTIAQLESLGEALFDFSAKADLIAYLDELD